MEQRSMIIWDAKSVAIAASLEVLPRVVPTVLVDQLLGELQSRVVFAFTEPGRVNYNDRVEVAGLFQGVLDREMSMGPWCTEQLATMMLAQIEVGYELLSVPLT